MNKAITNPIAQPRQLNKIHLDKLKTLLFEL